ncbi:MULTISPECIES: helix-turn-helix domain-containing protein [Rhizobium]|uniref:DNA-binding protein n=1 Tax=Rhizobium ruizarguesonis TaxID=2081791 RepID=A0AB38I4D3_9HYPH|nr:MULTISPECIES: helix-turn-helix domain-containing protein [Rhizobium]NEI22964.1 helix-turn-helix domain-containing protein [Rhizobium ruizarguesonis]NEI28704.1 helix-turn-helix domain-containing protein [Rhizobium ruizarguesonis]TAY93517.1 DNA-binding protein [Rhizobium ruizarguesonis]TAZ78155.1 DNA-binding protein [Rhizobium ruizarguesonis]TBA04532.1 DNA-binding protein [Rhizobium ruizarguesonis]
MQTRKEPSRATATVDEAAKKLGIGRNQCYEAVRRGQIPHLRIGKRVLILTAALDRILAGEQS